MPYIKRILGKTVLKQISKRNTSSLPSNSNFTKFEDYLTLRRLQAHKSILIQINEPKTSGKLGDYLVKNYGPLQSIFQYSLPTKGKGSGGWPSSIPPRGGEFHWILAEFQRYEDFQKAISASGFAQGSVPFTSGMTWFSHKGQGSGQEQGRKIVSEKLGEQNAEIDFGKGKNLSQQLKILEESMKLSELGVRIRFFVACQLENALGGLFPAGCILPFGSTVSGIGRKSGDLDLVLLTDKREMFTSQGEKSKDSVLWFQTKMQTSGSSSNARFQGQRVMETIADILQQFVPGCTHVQRILQARVPILRFWSDYTELQCDLSMTNSSGVHMSELIYIMTKLEPRFTTLLFAIRSWASARKITNPVPGRQPTNFMFVLLLIHFLQQKKILPTLDVLFNNPDKSDARVTADSIDCTFLRDKDAILKHFSPQCKTDSVADLLFQFFEFYSEFDFNSKGVSLLTGSAWGKPDAGPLYIQNPLERHLNVARNVSKEEVARFKNECCSALWKLETSRSEDQKISLKDLLLTPQYETKPSDHRIKIKELYNTD